jgi:hypothetical protein
MPKVCVRHAASRRGTEACVCVRVRQCLPSCMCHEGLCVRVLVFVQTGVCWCVSVCAYVCLSVFV